MSRLLVGGHKSHLEGVIEALHQEGIVHIEDYSDPTGITGIGTPLEAGDEASGLLVRARGLQKALGAESFAPVGVVDNAKSLLEEAEAATEVGLEKLRTLRDAWAKAEADEALLSPISGLDLDLAATAGLRSVRVFVGTARLDPTAAVQRTGSTHELQVTASGSAYAVALVVPVAAAGPVERALAESGFSPLAAPLVEGTPRQRLAAIATQKASLVKEIEVAEGDVAVLRQTWGARVAALEAVLADQVAKTQAPLKFGVTETTFHVEGWVPRGRVKQVEEALIARFGAQVYFHELGDAPREGTPSHDGAAHLPVSHGTDAGDHGEHDGEHHAHPGPEAEPPVHLSNPKVARPYEFLLGLLGKPRYHEIDPTKLMLVFFPIFFGLMVGDIVVGLVIMVFGLWLKKNNLFGIGGPAVGKALLAGGVLSVVIGLFVFGEAMGIHFVTPTPEPGVDAEMSWENVLGLHLASCDTGALLCKTGGAHAAPDSGALQVLQAEAVQHGGPLSPHSDEHLSIAGVIPLGIYSKIHDIAALLLWAVIIGAVHLILGFALGVRNVYVSHGVQLAIEEKAAWLMLIAGGVLSYFGSSMTGPDGMTTTGTVVLGGGLGVVAASIFLLYRGAAKVIGAGWIAFLEIPSLLGNLLSYTRLAAIGASKAGMVIAISAIAFTIMGGGPLGWLVYILGFICIIPLAILGAGLQSLRLQFVEFFQKFYTGGGRPYVPFGRRAA